MKKINVTFLVPDFYGFDDLKICIEEGTKESCALVESGSINGKQKCITTNMKIEESNKDKGTITLVEDHEKNQEEKIEREKNGKKRRKIICKKNG